MEKIKEIISSHKNTFIIGVIVFFILILLALLLIIAPPISENNYGKRLVDESKYKVSSTKIDEIKDTISKEDGVAKVTYHKEGRVLNFTIELEDGVVLDTAKKYAEEVVNKLSDKNKKYYDVQIFLDGNDEKYPIIGYHSKGSDSFSWGNAGEK